MVAHANACLKCGIYVFVYAAERVRWWKSVDENRNTLHLFSSLFVYVASMYFLLVFLHECVEYGIFSVMLPT